MPTLQDVQNTQGTRRDDTPPWMSYETEMGSQMSPELAAAVADYAEKHYEDAPVSSQTQEELARLKEDNTQAASQYQWLKPEEYADHKARIGRVMTHGEFITLLRKAGVNCYYTRHVHADKAVLYVFPNGLVDAQLACWAQIGQMPELSLMNFDAYGVPLAEKRRGWRTCLLQLILKGFITEEKAIKVFGRPRQDEAFDRYNGLLKAFRDAGNTLGE